MAPTWRPARAIDTLRAQINALAPNRSKASDGTIGDAAHAETKSGHNPNAAGVVVAMDITHDPAGGCDGNAIFASLIAGKDRRLQYIIWNRQIVNREVQPWKVRPYKGANPHDKHIHIEVDETPALYDDTFPWQVQVMPTARPSAPTQPPVQATVQPPPPPDVEAVPQNPVNAEPVSTGFLAWLFGLLARLVGKK